MNENHAEVCGSPEWAAFIQEEILPSLTQHAELGEEMLEIGPGPGAATAWLQHKVKKLIAIEVDEAAAAKLAQTYADSNVEVLTADATNLNYPDGSFDSVGSFTMLHHVPTAALQNQILAEAFRVLRPGGTLIASDSVPNTGLHHFHADDDYNPLDPGTVITRLQTLGFRDLIIMVGDTLRIVARKPSGEDSDGCDKEAEAAS
ncbi:MAG: class I SAM-dependent methyltransferase [Nocardiopsaceae bacterium]|jgi:SAM-dependent methyltransferase|nr:class I SAM-dependent methyltransferase [Nocardiopsaceae bacterium]